MSIEILDGATYRDFVEDKTAFNNSVKDRFASLDTNHDGLLSYSEMERELTSLRVLDGVELGPEELFAGFDRDGGGSVDMEEFRAEMKEMMIVVANGLGFLPVQMVVGEGSFLKKAVEKESAGRLPPKLA